MTSFWPQASIVQSACFFSHPVSMRHLSQSAPLVCNSLARACRGRHPAPHKPCSIRPHHAEFDVGLYAGNLAEYRSSASDLLAHVAWRANILKSLAPGSDIRCACFMARAPHFGPCRLLRPEHTTCLLRRAFAPHIDPAAPVRSLPATPTRGLTVQPPGLTCPSTATASWRRWPTPCPTPKWRPLRSTIAPASTCPST